VLDLGCGIGSVLLMLAWRFPDAAVVGVEAQALSLDLARRSIGR
jgi:tRNA1(Val) A37 N6-methylase TrmN6